jgi:hypothetical protein
MAITYPPAPVTLSGDVETINRFLQSPTLLTRRLRTLLENRFISDSLLTGRYVLQGGAVLFEQSESIYADRAVEQVAPGGEYALSGVTSGLAAVAAAAKWGQDALVTDEAIKRLMLDPVTRAILKLVNNLVKKVDQVALAAIASAVTQTTTALYAWAPGTANTNPLYDIGKAIGVIRALNQGYDPDTLVVDDLHYAQLMNNVTVLTAFAREDKSNPAYTGALPGPLAGLRVLVTPNLPTASTAIILDSRVLGGMADENLGGPGYSGQVKGVEGKTIRGELNDVWRLRARRVTVPVVIEPNAAYVITAI